MSIAKNVRADGGRLIIEDEDGGKWCYAKRAEASGNVVIVVDWSWSPVGNPPELVVGPDGYPLLHQSEPGLPTRIFVRVAGEPALGGPGGATWGGGIYIFEQESL